MPRIARIVIPNCPHHVIQRGNRRQRVFFSQGDYQTYLDLLAKWCEKAEVKIWAYCLMPNHVHLIAVPNSKTGLTKGIAEANRRYSCVINKREGWKGHLWQGRYSSYPMDERHLYYAARYIELNPVRSGLVKTPQDYQWSSARAHLAGKDDILVTVNPLLNQHQSWSEYLKEGLSKEVVEKIRKHEHTGRPLGSEFFIKTLEMTSGRRLMPGKPGPKVKRKHN